MKPSVAAVRYNHSKEVADGDDAKPTAAALELLERELICCGFLWERKPRGLYQPPKPRPSRAGMRRADPDYERAYRLRLREKRLRYGLVKPRNDMERAIAAESVEKPMQKVGDGPLAMWVAA